jgi:membrane protease YdiL (CAAX protease family)
MQAPLTPPPPERPELPEGLARRPAWPAWFAPVGFLVGIIGTLIVAGIVAAILGIDPDDDSVEFTVVATLAQGLLFAAAAIFFAGLVERPRPWHFGLRPTSLKTAAIWVVGAMAAFYLITGIYGAITQPDADQDVVEQLGGDQGTAGLIIAGVMVIVIAPVIEEFFFRGFFYGALRNRFAMVPAALITGVLFGAVHFNSDEGAEALLLLPPLGLLGFLFCVVYEKTGSLLPAIAMHAVNNAVAFGVAADEGWRVSLIVGPLMLAALCLAPRALPAAPRPLARAAPG